MRYEELIAGDLLPEALLAVRNVLLIAVALVLTLALVRRSDLGAATGASPVTVSQLPED